MRLTILFIQLLVAGVCVSYESLYAVSRQGDILSEPIPPGTRLGDCIYFAKTANDCAKCASKTYDNAVAKCDKEFDIDNVSISACEACGGDLVYIPWRHCNPGPFQTQTGLNACLDRNLESCYLDAITKRRDTMNLCLRWIRQKNTSSSNQGSYSE